MHAVIEYHDFTDAMVALLGDPTPATKYEQVWEGEVVASNPHDALGQLFERFNIGDHGGKLIRSMSVGDKVTVDGITFICKPLGWDLAGVVN
jgi:hypothetical protein